MGENEMRKIKCHFCGNRFEHECDPDIKVFANKDLQIAKHPMICGHQEDDGSFTPTDMTKILGEQKKLWIEKIRKMEKKYLEIRYGWRGFPHHYDMLGIKRLDGYKNAINDIIYMLNDD